MLLGYGREGSKAEHLRMPLNIVDLIQGGNDVGSFSAAVLQ